MNLSQKISDLWLAVRRPFRGKAKNLRIEQVADLFLKHLSRKGVDGSDAILLNFLDEKNIYYDASSLKGALALLLENKFIKDVPGTMAAVGYFDASDSTSHWISSIEDMIPQSAITPKGRYFIKKGQKLDNVGLAEAKAKKEKRIERAITFAIALVTAICVTLLTEPIKQFFMEHKFFSEHKSK